MAETRFDTQRGPVSPATDGGYAAQALRYERLIGWVLWIGLGMLLIVMGR
jgi:hypothetical protein